jgi:hypothetical protein
MSELNLHQQKAKLLKQLNYLWHNPELTQEQRELALKALQELLDLLRTN